MLKRFNRLLALAAVLFTGLGLWAAPPATDAPIPNRTAPPTVGGDQSVIVDRATRRRTLAAAREAAAARAQAALKARGGKVSPLALGQNPANADNAAKFAKANAALAGVKGAEQGLAVLPGTGIAGPGFQLKQPDYMLGTASNWHNTKPIKKFIDGLPGLGRANANNLGNFIPVAAQATTKTYPDSDYYEIGLRDYTQQLHSELPATKLRGYYDLSANAESTAPNPKAGVTNAGNASSYLGPVIIATRDRAVRVKMFNNLAKSNEILLPAIAEVKDSVTGKVTTAYQPPVYKGNLFLPVDTTVMGVGIGPNGGTEVFTQNRAELHLHGGTTPWISDGTPHQWFTPAGDPTSYKKGAVFMNVPDMMAPRTTAQDGDGIATYFWSNQQSGRFMFYHDHTFGLTRLNVYAGEAAGYLIVDPKVDGKLIKSATNPTGVLPNQGGGVYNYGIPLIIQDKTFVDTSRLGVIGELQTDPRTGLKTLPGTDPTWDVAKYGGDGSLWFPHVYMPNQNPADISGANGMGRWDYAQWFWPPYPLAINNPGGIGLQHGAQPLLATDPVSGLPIPILDPVTKLQLPVLGVLGAMILDPLTGQQVVVNGVPQFYTNSTTPVLLANGSPAMQWQLDPNGTEYPGTPNPSLCPEAFMDTPLVNGTPYPTITVDPTAYRFRILNAANDRNWNLSFFQADASGTEVPMVPSAPTPTFPAGWPTDGRDGGVPDPAASGPSFIQIGNESGFLPSPVVIPPTPINYTYNRRDIVVLSVQEKGLFLGPAERADVVVDFAPFAGKTLILYNDAPAPVPAFDVRFDYYTGMPDNTDTGGSIPTVAGSGPNTRTIMQFVVAPVMKKDGSAPSAPYDLAALNAAFTTTATSKGAFAESQHLPIVPQVAYNSALGKVITPAEELLFKNNVYLRIQDHKFRLPFPAMENGASIQPNLENKAIQELFELDYGRMNATLGVELPLTNAFTQTTIPLGYADPTTEDLTDGTTQYWKITHNGVDTHPVHFHLFDVQVINRVGWDGAVRLPDANEVGWKETLRMNPLEDIVVAFRPLSPRMPANMTASTGTALKLSTRVPVVTLPPGAPITWSDTASGNVVTGTNDATKGNFAWEYVWHCHILGHEENDFMRPMVLNVATKVPADPTTLVASAAISAGRADLRWTDNASDETGFSIQRRLGGTKDPFAEIGSTVPNQASYSDFTIQPNTAYDYQVVAYNQAGYSNPTDFATVGAQPISYSGQIYSVQGGVHVPTPGVVISFTGSSPNTTATYPNAGKVVTFQATTDATGAYVISLPYNWTGTVTPALVHFAFTPATLSLSSLVLNTVQNFVAQPTVVISGTVTTVAGQALQGVTVSFSNGGGTATTDVYGLYSKVLNSGYTGAAIPVLAATATSAGYTFAPVGTTYATPVTADLTAQDYIATPGLTIAGTISTATGPLPGVTVTYTPGSGALTSQDVITDSNGNYSLTLTPPYTGTVTPTLANHVFSTSPVTVPATASRSYSGVYPDQLGQNFTASVVVTIRGIITADYPAGTLAGVTLTASTGQTATSQGDGTYVFTNLPGPYTGTITPTLAATATAPAYAFTPLSRTYSTVSTDQVAQDYAAKAGVTISGIVSNAVSGSGEPGVTLTFVPGGTVTTNASGAYTVTLPAPYSGTITPSKVGFVFSPAASAAFSGLIAATTQNFVAQPIVTISGTVSGLPAGVTATLGTFDIVSAGNVLTATTVTSGAGGAYSFTVRAPYSATVTPSALGLSFTPGSRTYTLARADQTAQDYAAYLTLAGQVTLNGTGLPGVTMTYTGGTTTTDASGNYLINVAPGWTGTVTPTKPGYFITPLSMAYPTALNANLPAQNYTAVLAIQIFGLVTTSAVPALPLAGVTITISGAATLVTDANGLYTTYVPAGWSGTITPTLANWAFTPVNRTLTNVQTAPAGQHFTARQTVTVTGTITSNGAGLPGALVTFSGGAGSVLTGPNGSYSWIVNAGWTGTITATMRNTLFSPASVAITALPAAPTTVVYNFITVQTISGRTRVTDPVTGNRVPVVGVPITYTGGTAPVLTDANGNFTLRVPTGWTGTVTLGTGMANPVTGAPITSWTPANYTATALLLNVTGLRFNGN